jgi:Poxvirus Late Transcription Factor VLTF3 like
MRKEEFNLYEFHQELYQTVFPRISSAPRDHHDEHELRRKLTEDLSFREERAYKQQLLGMQTHLVVDATTELFFHHTQPLVNEYRALLNCTVRDSFLRKSKVAAPNLTRKLELIDAYLAQLQQHPELEPFAPRFTPDILNNHCEDCMCELEECTNETLICVECRREYPSFVPPENNKDQVTFKDMGRINTNLKYSYIRQTHFRDTIKQFQGKQNKYIDKKVYELLIGSFDANHLNQTNKFGKYTQITKDHIKMFLQEHALYKYYEDINLIHAELTGAACPNIAEYEKVLIEDFDKLVVVYDKVIKDNLKYNRSNFLNSYYILFQLLKRHAYVCKESDFPIIKTIERKIEHDEIYEECCKQLGWFFYPTV